MGSEDSGEPSRVPVQEAVEAGAKTAYGVGRADDGYYGEVRGVKSREDVIHGLECHKRVMYGEIDEHGFACNSCPYKDMESTCRSRTEGDLISDALALLKAQEAVEYVVHCKNADLSNGTEFACGECGGSLLHKKVNYCPWCGRAVKW